MNIRDRRGIHLAANKALEQPKGDPKRIILIYMGIVTALALAISVFNVVLNNRIADTGGLGNMGLRSILSTGQTLLPLVQSLVLLALEMGYCTTVLNIARGEAFSEQTLFSGFRRFFPLLRMQILLGLMYGGVALLSMYLSAYLFLMLPASEEFVALIMPLAESASSLTANITIDEATLMAAADAMMPMLWIFLGLFLLIFIPMHYQYRMAIYRLVDQPRPGALRAIHESRVMMRRNRVALLRLDLSLWWFYGLQLLTTVICYGDILLSAFGVQLPWSDTLTYFLALILSLAVQFAVYYFFMNRVAVVYATAYESLQPPKQNTQPATASVPWQNNY